MHNRPAALGFAIATLWLLASDPASAKSIWQKPIVLQCEMGPGADCNLKATCPEDMPFVATGAGGKLSMVGKAMFDVFANNRLESDYYSVGAAWKF